MGTKGKWMTLLGTEKYEQACGVFKCHGRGALVDFIVSSALTSEANMPFDVPRCVDAIVRHSRRLSTCKGMRVKRGTGSVLKVVKMLVDENIKLRAEVEAWKKERAELIDLLHLTDAVRKGD